MARGSAVLGAVGVAVAVGAHVDGAAAAPWWTSPANAANITVYHEIEARSESVLLCNQDAGDLFGDMYFVLRGFSLPVECASSNPLSKFDCDNPEENPAENVISQHTVLVDTRYGEYGECNINNQTGEYSCRCGESGRPPTPCSAAVGRADVSTRYIDRMPRGFNTENWQWWRVNLAFKTGGYWFSFFKPGECNSTSTPCYWQLEQTVRTIKSDCLRQRVFDAVRQHDTSCFEQCPQPTNASATCVVECFMAAVLGPEGGKRKLEPGEGIPLDVLSGAWKAAFATSDPSEGGCPDAGVRRQPKAQPAAGKLRTAIRAS